MECEQGTKSQLCIRICSGPCSSKVRVETAGYLQDFIEVATLFLCPYGFHLDPGARKTSPILQSMIKLRKNNTSTVEVNLKKESTLPWPHGSVGWSIIPCTERLWFNSHSGHISRLRVQSPVRAHTGGNCSMFLSHINLSLSLPPSVSRFPFLSKINKHILG